MQESNSQESINLSVIFNFMTFTGFLFHWKFLCHRFESFIRLGEGNLWFWSSVSKKIGSRCQGMLKLSWRKEKVYSKWFINKHYEWVSESLTNWPKSPTSWINGWLSYSGKGLRLGMLASETPYGGQLALSIQLNDSEWWNDWLADWLNNWLTYLLICWELELQTNWQTHRQITKQID